MPCPFLKEGRARYCHAAPLHKLILDGPGASESSRCTSPEYVDCEWVRADGPAQDRCPHLEQVRVQYCGASPVTKLVPFSDSQLSTCASNSYRYCDSYLMLARPHIAAAPTNLLYTANHFWIDAEETGLCHIGIDGLLADVAGTVDAVTFVSLQGTRCPSLALTIHGVEWPMNFPNPMIIQKVNCLVHRDPGRLTADPYGGGWLFEGWELPGRTLAGLVSGPQAAAWQKEERERLAREIHETCAAGCDGGTPVRGVARLLPRQNVVSLFQHFFSNRGWAVEE